MRRFIIIFFILLFSKAYAGEVDNYYAWEKPIDDSYLLFNTYLNGNIQKILEEINGDEAYLSEAACEDVALRIIDKLGTTWYLFYHSGALNTDMELWAEKNPDIDRVPRLGDSLKNYYKQSIYAPRMTYFGLWPTPIDVTINVGDVYFGTDKISHFLGSGYEYYKIFLKIREKTGSETQAYFKAIKWGIGMENGILGMGAVKVFSYSDLEANFQGLLLTLAFCEGENSNITFEGSKWVLRKQVDFRDHVNPNWNETFNVSTYTKNRLKKVKKNIAQLKLCDKLESHWIKSRLANYRNLEKNYEEKGFLDTSLSVRLLKLSQRYQFEDFSEDDFHQFAKKYPPGFNYEELSSYNEDLKLLNQKHHTLEQLCNPE